MIVLNLGALREHPSLRSEVPTVPDDGDRRMSMDLTGTDSSHLAVLRKWAGGVLHDLGKPHRDDLLLVLTEIIQNAYQHGDGARQVRLAGHWTPCEVVIDVDDNSLAPPVMRPRNPSMFGGRGLQLVDTLAAAWGSDQAPPSGGKTVWARVRCDQEDQEPCI